MTIEIDKDACTGCGTCYDVCPNYVIQKDGDRYIAEFPEICCDCGHCVALCNSNAIEHSEISREDMKDLEEISVSPDDLKNLMLSRRSIRCFTDDFPSDDQIESLLEVAKHAGTSSNGQTEGFILMKSSEKRDKLEEMVMETLWNAGLKHLGGDKDSIKAKLMYKILLKKYGAEMIGQYYAYHGIIKHRTENGERKGMVFRNAPLLIIIHGLENNVNSTANSSLAIRNMELLAQSMGLGAVNCGFLVAGFDKDPDGFRKELGIPEGRFINGALLIGKPKYKYSKKLPREDREVKWL